MKYTLMNAPMALATQQGIKTHTRRAIKDQTLAELVITGTDKIAYDEFVFRNSPYKIGEVLWVREPAKILNTSCGLKEGDKWHILYQFLSEGFPIDSYEMKQTDKLYSADMHGEVDFEEDRAFEWFTNLWESINGKDSFDNRYVWVIEFELLTRDEVLGLESLAVWGETDFNTGDCQ